MTLERFGGLFRFLHQPCIEHGPFRELESAIVRQNKRFQGLQNWSHHIAPEWHAFASTENGNRNTKTKKIQIIFISYFWLSGRIMKQKDVAGENRDFNFLFLMSHERRPRAMLISFNATYSLIHRPAAAFKLKAWFMLCRMAVPCAKYSWSTSSQGVMIVTRCELEDRLISTHDTHDGVWTKHHMWGLHSIYKKKKKNKTIDTITVL